MPRLNCIFRGVLFHSALLLIVQCSLAADWWPTPVLIRELHTESASAIGRTSMFSVDLGKGQQPLFARVCSSSNVLDDYRNNVYIIDRAWTPVVERNFAWHVWDVKGLDFTGQGHNVVGFTYAGDTLAGVRVFDSLNGDTLWDYSINEKDFRWRGRLDKWDPYFEFGPVIELGQERRGVVLLLQTGFCQMPRGIIVLDVKTGHPVWNSWHASNPEDCIDVSTSDGQHLLVVSTTSSANGAEWGMTSDDRSYLYALNANTGEVVWQWEFPGTFSRVKVLPLLSQDGTTFRLLALFGSSTDAENPPTLMDVNPIDGKILRTKEFPANSIVSNFLVSETSVDSAWLAYVAVRGAGLFVVDSSFEIVRQRPDIAELFLLGNWNKKCLPGAVVTTAKGELVCLDKDLRTSARKELNAYVQAVNYYPGSPWPEFWAISNDHEYFMTLERNHRFVWEVLTVTILPALIVFALVFLTTIAIKTRRAYVKARNEKLVLEGWAQTASFQAHDTKKPIAVVQRALDNLELRLHRDSPGVDIGPFLKRVRGEIGRMLQTSRQIQVVSRVTKPNLSDNDLNALIIETVERMNSLNISDVKYDAKNGELHFAFDYRLIESMLENLIGNAMDAVADTGGSVQVLAKRVDLNAEHMVHIQVSDSGKGMTKELITEIMDGKGSKKKGGQGLGILCAKWIAETHSGNMTIESTPNQGTTVTVTLPDRTGGTS